jgi:hypothetical protein
MIGHEKGSAFCHGPAGFGFRFCANAPSSSSPTTIIAALCQGAVKG